METIIDTWALGSQAVADAIKMPVKTLRVWQDRYTLLPHCTSGRGRPATFLFADALDVLLAKKLMGIGLDGASTCHYVSSVRPALSQFINGRPVEVAIGDDRIVFTRDQQRDPFISIPLEAEGWEVATAFFDDIGHKRGAEAAVEAERQLRTAVTSARSGSLVF